MASSGDQVVTAESGWASKELMDLIEAVPYYDQFISSFEEMIALGLRSYKVVTGLISEDTRVPFR